MENEIQKSRLIVTVTCEFVIDLIKIGFVLGQLFRFSAIMKGHNLGCTFAPLGSSKAGLLTWTIVRRNISRVKMTKMTIKLRRKGIKDKSRLFPSGHRDRVSVIALYQ